MTHNSGLLILCSIIHKQKLSHLFKFAKNIVRNKLFVTVPQSGEDLNYWKNAVSLCYMIAAETCPLLDVRLVLPITTTIPRSLQFDVVLSQLADLQLAQSLAIQLNPLYKNEFLFAYDDKQTAVVNSSIGFDPRRKNPVQGSFSHVCLGGTFDHLHNGHKILLSTGGLLATEELLVGITSCSMLQHKQLAPLIYSWERRSEEVKHFLQDIGIPECRFQVIELNDPFGPPATRPEFQCIVTSEEVLKTCEHLNKARQDNGFKPLTVERIEFVSGAQPITELLPAQLCDNKLSSSAIRFHLLGTLLRPANSCGWSQRGPHAPYVIGLAGPSGAGKSALARRLAGLSTSVHVIDCDRLGHEAYLPGTNCHRALLDRFGRDTIASPDPPYPIDRSKLGKIVFSNPELLDALNAIVWPEIEQSIHKKLEAIQSETHESQLDSTSVSRPIVVLDAAVLLQAEWNRMCDEIWIAVIPREEAKRRVCERMNLEPAVVDDRLDRQAAAIASATGGLDWWYPGQLDQGIGPVGHAHVVLSTEWDPECSQKQVERAFVALCKRIPP